ncbi:uncharacterized protein LOC120822371 [Gasterosteus aculeatus]
MSRPLRYASGDQSSTAQGQHGPTGAQAEEDPPGPGSSISSSVNSAHSGGTPPPMSCRPERSRVTSRSIDVQIGRARAGAGLLRKSTLQPRGRRVTGIQRERLSSATGMVSYPVPSTYASKGHGHPGMEIASDPSRPREDEPSKLSSALSSNPPSRGDSVLMVSIDRKHVTLSLPVLSTSESPLSDTPATPTPPSRLSVSESASNILRRFGLEKEDLDHLVSYPEDQITPASLPFILRQIGIEKTERALGASRRKARPEPQPAPSQSVVGGDGVSHPGGAARFQEESSSAVLEPHSKVTDGGRGDECVEGAAGEVGSVSRETCGGNGSTSPADAAGNKTKVESVALLLSSLGPLDASKLSCAASPISDQTQMQIQANRQTLPGSSSMPSTAVESEAADPVDPLIDQESSPGHRSASPKPDPVLVGSSDHDCQSTAQVSQTISLPASSAAESVARLPSVPACPPPAACPPAQPVPGPSDVTQPTPPSSDQQPAAEKVSVSKGVPSAATMSDGAAATPGRFPHTCRPCRSKCLQMKDWISHQNTDLHLERCKHLRLRYPEWDGEIPSSRSRSPHSSRSQSGSRPTSSRYRSCLTSPERRRDDKGSLPRRRDERRSASRSRDERRSTLRSRDDKRSTSRNRDERRSTSRSRDDKRSTSRSRDERRSTSRSRDERRSTSRSRDDKRSTSRSRDDKRSTSRSRDDKQSTSKGKDDKRSSSRNRDERRSTLRSRDDKRSTSRSRDERRSTSKGKDDKRSTSRSRDERRSTLRSRDERRSTLRSRDERRSTSRNRDERRSTSRNRDERRSTLRSRDERRSTSKGKDDKRSTSRSRDERRSTSRSRDERRSTSRSRNDRRSTSRSRNERRSTSRSRDERRSTLRSRDDKRSTSRSRDERRSTSKGKDDKRSTSRSRDERRSTLRTVDLLSKPSDLDALLQTLAPIVLAELAKRKSPSPSSSSSSSSSSSYSPGETSSSPAASSSPPPAKKRLTQKPSEASPSPKAECGKPSPPTMVKLTGIHASLSRSDVLAAVQHFGKTKSFLLFPSKLEAIVCFENKEDATKLKSLKSLDVKGIRITVFEGKKAVCHRKQKPLITAGAAAASSIFTPEGAVTRKVLLPTPDGPPLEWPEKPPPAPPGARKGPFEGRGSASEGSRVSCAHGPEAPQACHTRPPLTVGEIIEKHLSRERMKHFKKENVSLESEIECFEEDAKKSNSPMSSDLKGIKVTVAGGKKTVTKEQKKPLTAASSSVHHNTPTRKVSQTLDPAGAEEEEAAEAEPGGFGRRSPRQAAAGAVSAATVGERVEKHLRRYRLRLFEEESVFGEQDLPRHCKLLLITNLPPYHHGSYTEEELAALLAPFGFRYADDSIFVVPQTCMAFFQVPAVGVTQEIMKASARDGVFFKRSKLVFSAVAGGVAMTPLGFYKSLMELMCFNVQDDGQRIVFIRDISTKESSELRDALNKIQSVKNFLPLLNQAFVEFKTVRDADRLGVWYGLLRRAPGHQVHRLKAPSAGLKSAPPPKLPGNALPDGTDAVAGATVPPTTSGVPRGSVGPFWVTTRTHPFLFPTRSPWFIIPDFLTSRTQNNLMKAVRGPKIPTVMLTGLPEGNYRHEDVAELVRPYFPGWSLYSAYYDVVVLPLQRRAFVFFADWSSCCSFVRDHIRNPVAVGLRPLTAHFVLEDISPFSTEEAMYATMMTWSNAGVPEPEGLEERLLCVETSETSPHVTRAVVGAVASVASLAGFLPLANRICIEMSDAGGVTEVVEKHRDCFLWMKNAAVWNSVLRVESLKSLKRRLEDPDEVVNIEAHAVKSKIILIE